LAYGNALVTRILRSDLTRGLAEALFDTELYSYL
jgi:hypothetical protein